MQYGAICPNSSQIVKLKMCLLQLLCVLQSCFKVTSTRHETHVARINADLMGASNLSRDSN